MVLINPSRADKMRLNPNLLNDVYITNEGELEVSPTGDFKLVEGSDAAICSALFRAKTVLGDFILEPECGASLEQVIGEPNSPETGALVESLLTRAFTHDGFFSSSQLNITVLPMDTNTIGAIVVITYDGQEVSLSTTIDLREGQVQVNRV
jgi:hypothetical protein